MPRPKSSPNTTRRLRRERNLRYREDLRTRQTTANSADAAAPHGADPDARRSPGYYGQTTIEEGLGMPASDVGPIQMSSIPPLLYFYRRS